MRLVRILIALMCVSFFVDCGREHKNRAHKKSSKSEKTTAKKDEGNTAQKAKNLPAGSETKKEAIVGIWVSQGRKLGDVSIQTFFAFSEDRLQVFEKCRSAGDSDAVAAGETAIKLRDGTVGIASPIEGKDNVGGLDCVLKFDPGSQLQYRITGNQLLLTSQKDKMNYRLTKATEAQIGEVVAMAVQSKLKNGKIVN